MPQQAPPQHAPPVTYVEEQYHPSPHLPPEEQYRSDHMSHVTPLELRYIRQAHLSDSYAIEPRKVPPPGVSASGPYYQASVVDPYQVETMRAYYPENPIRAEHPIRTERTMLRVSIGGLQVQTRSQAVGAVHKERDSEQDEREVVYSL
ncbi:hypothetical protein BHE74_00012082 [Ensete ventricosum]|nr:hypothetical protein BHE74_00012082 [Ensete ventricosum]